MSIALLFESMSAAASIGMGCGTCCGSGISAALYSYLTTHTKNIKQSIRAFLDFFFGKLIAVILLCSIASCVGGSIIDDTGRIMGVKTALIADAVMLTMGIWFLIGWIREKKCSSSCKRCKGCKTENDDKITVDKRHHAALIVMGFGYGISPCAPLILITGYATTLPLTFAVVLGALFSIASTISPIIIIMLLSGVLAKGMNKEIPQYLTWFRLGCYILMIILFAIGFIKEIVG